MKLAATALAAMTALAARSVFAKPAIDPELPVRKLELEALAHFGVSTNTFEVATLREAKGQAFVFLAAGRYAVSAPLSLELVTPLVLGSVAQPAGSYVDASALGNPQLGARLRLLQRASPTSELTLNAAAELGVPLASHDDDLMPNRLLAIADGIEGRGHPEYFTPGVVPFTPSTSLAFRTGSWTLGAELRLPSLTRVSRADLPRPASNPKRLGLAAVVGIEARYRASRRFSLAAAAHLALDLIPVAERVANSSRLQDFERLSLHVHFGPSAALLFDLQTAAAGDLGGNTLAGGLRFRIALP